MVIVPSFRSKPSINYMVYKKLFEELTKYGAISRVAACITDPNDVDVIEKARAGHDIRIDYLPQNGKGKRVAMSEALRLFYRQGYAEDAQLVLMDGDSLLCDDVFEQCSPFLVKYRDLGAITTHNRALVNGSGIVTQWYRQRMSQRHFYMNSVSLSHQLMVLTGRFSMFKASILINPEFIHRLEHDTIEHWRTGKVKMLTGDDKSTWFELLSNKWKMLYLPDVIINCLEDPPQDNFFTSSINLMRRWYGNMLRNNGRALKLGPKHCGFFLWLCLLDQRISIWTALTGPIFVLLVAASVSPIVIAAYFVWVIIGRSINCLIVASMTKQFHPLFVVLLWYEQVVGSFLKVIVMFRLDRQKWTRQSIETSHSENAFVSRIMPRMLTTASLVLLALGLALLHGILQLPSVF
nr:glycosyltransferase [Vibrio intestinalis]